MKNYFLASIISLILFSCGENKILNAPTNNNPSTSGAVSLVFDKTTVPNGVVTVTAVLSRSGYTPFSKSLSLHSDSSAKTIFENIPIGMWKLKIDAKNNENIVLYSGQTDLTVVEGTVTNLNLVLQPVATGTGSIKITVSWGYIPSGWIDNTTNPILKKQNTIYDGRGIGYPIVLKDDSVYRMWYLNIQNQPDSNGAMSSIGLATSNDGSIWTHYSKTPVMKPIINGWNSVIMATGPVIKEGDTYKMYYDGYGKNGVVFKIGMATSKDGIIWEQRTEPILQGSSGWENNSIGVWGVVKVNGIYYMYYHSHSIGVATSTDGITWTKYSGNPIITPSQSWERSAVGMASVIYDNGEFKMVYQNEDYSQSFGYATSKDGLNWTKDVSNPIFSRIKINNTWAQTAIAYASITKVGTQERIYYTGFVSSATDMQIGFAYKK